MRVAGSVSRPIIDTRSDAMKAVVVFSGGQDSTTCLFWAIQKYGKENARALSFDYGQRHAVELEAASRIAGMAGVSHKVAKVPQVLLSSSPLTSDTPLETYQSYSEMDEVIGNRVELTFVPMRNAFFLTLAANHAVAWDAYRLVTGVCESDNANYPDCRKSFIAAQQETINQALGISGFEIEAPLIDLDKEGIVRLAKPLPGCWDALAWSHTCYAGKTPPCGECHSCVLRAEGFRRAGEIDPLMERFL